MSHELIVFVTISSHNEAASMADALVTERLAGCVNIIDAVESIYRWQGKVKHDRETLMIIKTTSLSYAELEQRVRELHSYDTPEIVAVEINRGSEGYLEWLRDSTVKEDVRNDDADT